MGKELTNEPKMLIIRPLGPQGPKLCLQINGEGEFKKFDEAVGELPVNQRHTYEGLRNAALKTNIPIVDS